MIRPLILFLLFSHVALAQTAPEYRVGLGEEDVTPPIGTPLAGSGGPERRMKGFIDWLGKYPYSNFLKPSIGILDPIRSKAMVVERAGKKILFVSLDVVGVTRNISDSLRVQFKRYGFEEIYISATHTHSGPGAMSKSWVWEVMATDKFRSEIFWPFLAGVERSVKKALAAMEPARLWRASLTTEDIQHNRRNHKDHFDPVGRLIVAQTPDNRWLGGIVNYAIHGVAIDDVLMKFSADAPGGIERHLAAYFAGRSSKPVTPVMLFINGAEGDVSPNYDQPEGVEKMGAMFAEQTAKAFDAAAKEVTGPWKLHSTTVRLDKGRIDLAACNVKAGGSPLKIKFKIREKNLPRDATIWRIEWSGMNILTWPGEPLTSMFDLTNAAAEKLGLERVWTFGLTNGHMGYFPTAAEFIEGGYEPCVALHGNRSGEMLAAAHGKLLQEK